jgi:hypothetical protein
MAIHTKTFTVTNTHLDGTKTWGVSQRKATHLGMESGIGNGVIGNWLTWEH